MNLESTYPRMVLHKIRAGARKWIGPLLGLVFILFLKNLRYFIFWRTRPPDKQISSHRTTTCWRHKIRFLFFSKESNAIKWGGGTYNFLAIEKLLGEDGRQAAEHVVTSIDTTTLAQRPEPDTMVTGSADDDEVDVLKEPLWLWRSSTKGSTKELRARLHALKP